MEISERKALIAKAKEQDLIRKAIAEEKRIIASKPIHFMSQDPNLAHLPKREAIKIINQRRENMARGIATINEEVTLPKEEPKVAEEKPKRGRRKKIE